MLHLTQLTFLNRSPLAGGRTMLEYILKFKEILIYKMIMSKITQLSVGITLLHSMFSQCNSSKKTLVLFLLSADITGFKANLTYLSFVPQQRSA